ncbi:protein dispatched [Euwallacea fornicatus]|uniref:protein dispatched n=1 Tax=Euwallacea fornicatus TaxID=995702 RepID=UPI00338F8777
MNCERWYINIIIRYPYIVLLVISLLSCICLILPFTMRNLNAFNFQDPQMGFSTRNTLISNRLTAWENLQREIRPSGILTKNPKEFLAANHLNTTTVVSSTPYIKRRGSKKKNKQQNRIHANQIEAEDSERNKLVFGKLMNTSERDSLDMLEKNKWRDLQNLTGYHPSEVLVSYEEQFCGQPDEKYAHMVVTTKNEDNLFTLQYLRSLCKLERVIMNSRLMKGRCISNNQEQGKCCKPWSLPNYVATLFDRHSCLTITEDDVNGTLSILEKCANYFHENRLDGKCLKRKNCDVPLQCIKHDAVYSILKYLASITYFPRGEVDASTQELKETILFLPVAAGIASVPLYHDITSLGTDFEGLSIVAMDFGIKSTIFDEYLIRDTRLMALGTLFVLLCVWIYTTSIFLTIMTIISILFVLIVSYFLYKVVYGISFFPFMNVLTVVICIGLGADNTFILCKFWQVNKIRQSASNDTNKIMIATFHHALKSLCITSLTTAVAFWGSYFTSVTAIVCFSIFAGTAIVINFILTISWVPACLIIRENSCFSRMTPYYSMLSKTVGLLCATKWSKKLAAKWNCPEEFLIEAVVHLRYFWIVGFTSLALASSFIVFVKPGLVLPTSVDFQLLLSSHPFEKYDFIYKQKFLFNKEKEDYSITEYKMPLRFVWGVLPVDNGNHLDPVNLGNIVLDSSFDMAHASSQMWLKNFCRDIKLQPFFQPIMGISLTSCFIHTFISSMERRCYDSFAKEDKSPCCSLSKFPFNRTTFNYCVIEEMAEIYDGPPEYVYPKTSGAFFSKGESPSIRAVALEFDSNVSFSISYKNIDRFYKEVMDWATPYLSTAPPTMQNGFFTSDLNFYDLQQELISGTKLSILTSMLLASGVLMLTTLNPLLTFLSIVTVFFTIITTIAGLILCGWTLNILESVAISTSIGLAVDFSLHYCVNYKLCPSDIRKSREDATRYSLSCLMGPSFMAGLTTAGAGFFMLFSEILPYFQVGLFLVIIMSISWAYATFYLGSLLYILGPSENCLRYSYIKLRRKLVLRKDKSVRHENKEAIANTSSCTDLENVSFISHNTDTSKQKKSSFDEPCVKYVPNHGLKSQSPISNITILMGDDKTLD